MSEIILASIALLYAGWIGHVMGKKAGIREGVKLLANNIDPSHLRFAHESIKCARKVADTRRVVGSGPEIWQDGIWTIEGLGKFKVRIQDQETVDA